MAEADATAAAPAEEPEEEHPPLTLEEGEDKVKIMALFKKLALADLQEDGKQPTISVEAMKQGGNTALGKGSVNFLKTICQMDFNGDGDVEESEWEMFFAMLKQDNDAKQIDDILNQMEEASGDVIAIAMASAAAAQDDDGTMGYDAEEAAAMIQEAIDALGEAEHALIDTLFKAWDWNDDGKIEIARLSSNGVNMGPHKASVFSQLEKMDLDADGHVDKKEMQTYFGLLKQMTTAEEFQSAISEMSDAATAEKDVYRFILLNAEYNRSALILDDDDAKADAEAAAAALPDLSDERLVKVKALFQTFEQDLSKNINLKSLEATKIDNGPVSSSGGFADSMKMMDANGDGELEYKEMLDYFKAIGAELDEDNFNIVLDGLTESAATSISLMTAEAQSKS